MVSNPAHRKPVPWRPHSARTMRLHAIQRELVALMDSAPPESEELLLTACESLQAALQVERKTTDV